MEIINDDRIFKKFFEFTSKSFKRKLNNINEIVIHGTGGGKSARAIINWMLSGERAEKYKRGIALFHIEIDPSGDVFNIVSPSYWVYHSSSGKHDKYTIGIELVNDGKDNTGEYTDEQYKSLFYLLTQMIEAFPIDTICGHGYNKQKYSGEYKECPGKNFNWEIIEDLGFKKIENECYRI